MSDAFEVRPRSPGETQRWLDAEESRRADPSFDAVAPQQVPGRVRMDGSRGRLAGIRVTPPVGYSWRWPWRSHAHLDVVDCDLEGVRIGRVLRSSKLDDCTFERVMMGGAAIGGATFTECAFQHASLVGTGMAIVRNSTFRRSSIIRLDARRALFDRVTFDACTIDGLRGQATIFRRCSFLDTQFRGRISGIVLDGCSFDRVDMSGARVSRSFIIDSRILGEFVYPGHEQGFAIDYEVYRTAVAELVPSLADADAMALRQEIGSWATNPPAEVLIDDQALRMLSRQGRLIAMNALFARRLVRRS